MEYRNLGRTGVKVSPICLGTMNFGKAKATDEKEAIRIIDLAIDKGINFIDTADVYNKGESEKIVGKALKIDNKRDRVVLATKFYNKVGPDINDQGVSRYHIIKACEDSLEKLQTDHIDLYQLHRPGFDVPQDETLRALDDLVTAGKVLYIGTTTFPAWFLMEGLAVSEKYGFTRFVSEQPPYNFLDRRAENELIPLCQKYGLSVIPWSPLAGGILAGRYKSIDDKPEGSKVTRGNPMFAARITKKSIEVVQKLEEMAKERNLLIAQLSLLWLKDQPGITAPIVGPRTMEHIEQALDIIDKNLSEDDRPIFDNLVHPGNAVSDFYNSSGWMKEVISD